MKAKLFDVLVAAICNHITSPIELREILLSEIYDLDDNISDEQADDIAEYMLTNQYIEAENVASQLNREATIYLYEREIATRGW